MVINESASPQGSKKAFVQNGRAILVESGKNHYSAKRKFIAHMSVEAYEDKWLRAEKDEPLKVEIWFISVKPKSAVKRVWHTVKPDIDKQVRFVLDCITQTYKIWADDSQVVELIAHKVYGESNQTKVQVSRLA